MAFPGWVSKLYNRIFPKNPKCGYNLQDAMTTATTSSSFYHDELSRALSEQSFALTRYEATKQYSAHEATAAVTLLEGSNVRVYLNARGYQLDGGQTYESIEELLQSVSPMYVRKREDMIISKLQGLQ